MESDECDDDFYPSCQCAGICGLHAGMCDITVREAFGVGASVSRHGMLCRRCTAGEFAPGPLGLRITVSTVSLRDERELPRSVEYATLPAELTRDGAQTVAKQLVQRLEGNAELLGAVVYEAYREATSAAAATTATLETDTPVPPSSQYDHALQHWRPSLTPSVMRIAEFLSRRPMLRGLLVGWLGLVCFVGVLTGLPVNVAALAGGSNDLLLARARLDVLLWAVDLVVVLPALVYILRHYWLQRMLLRRLRVSGTNPLTWPGIARIVEASKPGPDALDHFSEMERVRARVQGLLRQADPVERMFCEMAWNMRSER